MFNKISLCVAVAAMVGCHSNPYTGISGTLSPNPVTHSPAPTNDFTCDLPPYQNLSEGQNVNLTPLCRVPTGKPVLSLENNPAWVTLNPTTGVLTLAPQSGDAMDPAHPSANLREYTVIIDLASSDSPVAKSQQTLVVIVNHVLQGLTVSGFDPAAHINEGTSYQATLQITSADAPTGPFYLSGVDLPAGVNIASTNDPTKFTLNYAPGFTTVMLNTAQRSCYDPNSNIHRCNDLNINLNIVDGRGNTSTLAGTWSVLDIRQNPLVVTPSPIVATLPDADFYIQVEDPNGEISPQVTAIPPAAGTVTTTMVASGPLSSQGNPYSMTHAVWTGNPTTDKGTTQTLQIKSCVQDDIASYQQCVTTPVNVSF